MVTKVCTVCKDDLDVDMFYNSIKSKDGKAYRCKVCDNLARQANRVKSEAKWQASSRRRRIENRYGLTEDSLRDLMNKQRGCCDICGLSLIDPKDGKTYAIDHNHNTGKVRGLLCLHCNAMLGQAMDNINVLAKGILYLQKKGSYGTH